MGVVIPQVVSATEDRASGAQIVDGGLRFDSSKSQHLNRTFSSGNRKTWTLAFWIKFTGKTAESSQTNLFGVSEGAVTTTHRLFIDDASGVLYFESANATVKLQTTQVFRDYSAWYHIVLAFDTTQTFAEDRQKLYVNGIEAPLSSNLPPNQNTDYGINNNVQHNLGRINFSPARYSNVSLSQVYFIDGQALGPGYFGYTDPLTNTWRPRKRAKQGAPTVNNGTVWSSFTTPGSSFRSGFPAVDAFNGIVKTSTNDCAGVSGTAGDFIEFDFSSLGGVPFSTLEMQCDPNGEGPVYVNGIEVTSQFTAGSLAPKTLTGITSPLTTIKLVKTATNTSSVYLGSVIIDGVMMTDSTTTTVDFSTNGFYLPFDGSAPIGEDQSGQGNDWTPTNFGGSASLEKATGALPILNTLGGTVARPGVFGSEVGAYYAVTVPGGIGGGYYLDGTQKPTLSLIRGATYTFDQSDSSNSGHPLVFATTADGNDYSDGVTTNGTPGSAGAYTKITVPHNAPDTLYYHCSAHGGMGSSTTQTTDTKKADPYAWKNVLAIPFIGNSTDISNQINSGSSTKTTTDSGVTYPTTTTNFYGSSAVYFDSSDTITLGGTWFGDTNFTVEFWAYITDYGDLWTVGGNNCSFTVASNYISIDGNGVGRVNFTIASGIKIPLNKWTHFAYVKDSSSYYMFIDGVKWVSPATGGGQNSGTWVLGGTRSDVSDSADWYLQDLRYYSTAKYTENFIPASTDPDILPDSPSGVSYSSNLTQITDGAVSFDGSGDYLSLASSSDFGLGTDDYTIEYWYYNNKATGAETFIWDTRDGTNNQPIAYYNTSGTLLYYFNGTSRITISNAWGQGRWQHHAFVRSGTTIKAYIDGIEAGSVTGSFTHESTAKLNIGSSQSGTGPITGFISNFRFIKGTALYTSNFTPPTRALTDVTNTKLLCCQSPTSATAAAVAPGSITANGDAAATNFNPFTTDINAVRGQESGYCTLNPLTANSGTLSQGNLRVVVPNGTRNEGTITVSSGKWYWEGYAEANMRTSYIGGRIAICASSTNTNAEQVAFNVDWHASVGIQKRMNGTSTTVVSGVSYNDGDLIGVGLDADGNIVYFYKNGILAGSYDFSSDLTPGSAPLTPHSWGFFNSTWQYNFGQKPFKFPPPAGFQPLTLANTPRPSIVRPDQYVGIVTYIGNDTGQSIGGLSFSPDFVWIKDRSGTNNHMLFDTVRGTNGKNLISNQSAIEGAAGSDDLTAFNSDGFTLGANNAVNNLNVSFVAWTWKAGGNSNTFNIDDVGYATASAAGLTGGTITPTGASVGTKQGFSIIKFTGNGTQGATISHGLNDVPEFLMIKNLSSAQQWDVYHTSTGYGGVLRLNSNAAFVSAGDVYPSSHTTSTIKLGDSSSQNGNTNNMIAYCWHSVPGFSKFGSYTANSTGVFIELGFKPALLVIKNSSNQLTNSQWNVVDTVRDPFNESFNNLAWDRTNSEPAVDAATYGIDIVSNGFHIPSGNTGEAINNLSQNYIYMAWAEAPTFNLYGGQANAR